MVVTIIILAVLLFFGTVAAGFRFIYLLISPHTTMQSDTKVKALDIFLYLGIAISLVTSVTSILQVLFTAINRKFPNVLDYTYIDVSQSDVRFAIASLVVMFPIYVGLSWYVSKDIKKFLYKQDIPVRKMMIYCTLFVTVLTLIGTLVSTVYYYLGGELSSQFGLKAGAVFVVALSLFAYYYYSLKRDYSSPTIVPNLIMIFATLVVASSIAWSISIIGTPSEMRAKKIDSTRLSDISRIQQEVFNRFQATDKLPLSLTELDNPFQGYQIPVDPISKEAYSYKVIQQPIMKMNYTTNKKEMASQAIFELCAKFDTVRAIDSRGQAIPVKGELGGGLLSTDALYSASNYYYDGDVSPFWNHGIGEMCFKRIITADMYYGR